MEAATEIVVASKITDNFRGKIFSLAVPSIPDDHPIDLPPPIGRWHWRFLNDILRCGYCSSVWIAGLAAICAPHFELWAVDWMVLLVINCIVNWIIMTFTLHRLSNYLHDGFMIIKKGRVKTHDVALVLSLNQVNDGSNGPTGST